MHANGDFERRDVASGRCLAEEITSRFMRRWPRCADSNARHRPPADDAMAVDRDPDLAIERGTCRSNEEGAKAMAEAAHDPGPEREPPEVGDGFEPSRYDPRVFELVTASYRQGISRT